MTVNKRRARESKSSGDTQRKQTPVTFFAKFIYQRMAMDAPPEVASSPLWPPSTLSLYSDFTVSFGTGPRHGSWMFTGDGHIDVEFHWLGRLDEMGMHHYIRVGTTNTWLERCGNNCDGAVLVEQERVRRTRHVVRSPWSGCRLSRCVDLAITPCEGMGPGSRCALCLQIGVHMQCGCRPCGWT